MWRIRERCTALKHGIELDDRRISELVVAASTYADERTVLIGGWTLPSMVEGAGAQNKVRI
jgi:hypothetical protein